SRGLGLVYVEELLKNPENFVIATARNPSTAAELGALAAKYSNDRVAVLQLDMASPESIQNAATEAIKLFPEGLDCLVGNAGTNDQPVPTFEQLDLKLFSEELNLMIINNTILIRSFLPLIRKGKPGKLIFISSVLGSVELAATLPTLNDAYSVSRAALNMLIRKWGAALKSEGISSAIVHPGLVATTEIGSGITKWMEKNAPHVPKTPIAECAAGSVKIFETLNIENTNSFYSAVDGSKLPW
ncbi:putative oxidoreductase, partial [Lachnellula suecica]